MIKSNQVLIEMDFEKYSEMEYLLETGKYGLEINDFCNPAVMCDNALYEKRIFDYQKVIKKYSDRFITMHGAFFGLVIHSRDADIARISKDKIIKSLQTAAELNCRKIVFHTGIIPQAVGHILNNIATIHFDFWAELLERNKHIEICIENVWEQNAEFFEILLSKINSLRFTMCIDNGHANVYSTTTFFDWINNLKKHISHVHLSDNDKRTDQHLGLGDGQLRILSEIDELVKINGKLTYKLEVHTPAGIKKSIQYLIDNKVMQL